MIEVWNLTKEYGNLKAVSDLNFKVEKGEILGFLGPNGAGKTTTMNMITGYIPPSTGSVKVNGYDVVENPKEVKKNIGYLPETPPLYQDMTVMEYLDFVSDLKLISGVLKKAQIFDILEVVRITDVKNRLIKNLSKGYKQRIGIAQALIGDPKVLILDEPTVGLDPQQIIEMRNLIKHLGKEHTIILSSHILPEVSAICDRVVIINKGKIVAIDSPQNLSNVLIPANEVFVTIEGVSDVVVNQMNAIEGVKSVEVLNEEKGISSFVIQVEKNIDIRRPLFFTMSKVGMPILELKTRDFSLEDIFLQLITEEVPTKEENNHDDNI